MADLINGKLIEIIVCPVCAGALCADPMQCQLVCSGCASCYDIKDGIPLLYPKDTDSHRLKEEEALAARMLTPDDTPRGRFSSFQWAFSKQEFWSVVNSCIPQTPVRMLNIGCGVDDGFSFFEQRGHEFVNFDLVVAVLEHLQRRHQAQFCVAGDFRRMPFRPGQFDVVILTDLLHHDETYIVELLRSALNLLKPGGKIFIEDVNAWGMFQIPKTLLIPRVFYRRLRSLYHALFRPHHAPADYEFPTSMKAVKAILRGLGYERIRAYPHDAYPNISPAFYKIYRFLGYIRHVKEYHNYHYFLSAERAGLRNNRGS